MTRATEMLIGELCGIVDKCRFLLITGSTAVGKSTIAQEVAKRSANAQYSNQGKLHPHNSEYRVDISFVPVHSGFTYEDFVIGNSINTVCNQIDIRPQDKIFLKLIIEAKQSWVAHEDKKYFLILDDIGRGMISAIFGDMLSLIEPHGESTAAFYFHNDQHHKLWIPPNVYIIATESTTVEPVDSGIYGFLRRFYHFELKSDFQYMCDTALGAYSDYSVTPQAMYLRSRKIVEENLRNRSQMSVAERNKYTLGHGYFRMHNVSMYMRHQVIPTLKQYVKDGVLESSAVVHIDALQHLLDSRFIKDPDAAEHSRIRGYREDVTPDIYYDDSLTHKPIVNLIARIKKQGLINDSELASSILFHPGVIVRTSAKVDGITRLYPSPGYLYIKKEDRDLYIYGTTRKADGTPKRPRFFYSSKAEDILSIDGIDYCVAGEMQPKEYTRWSDELDSDDFINERASSSPNSTMFRILRSYYHILSSNYAGYLVDFPDDENIRHLKAYLDFEFSSFTDFVKMIGSGSDDADVNLERNRVFRKAISELKLLWCDIGGAITWNGQTIKVEGVYKMDTMMKYSEYQRAMSELGIHQMILQGPPGTSKTFSAREYLRFVGGKGGNMLSPEELDACLIKGYNDDGFISGWSSIPGSEKQRIAWDIVQFHPSYGYEDFVRGIEVSTSKNPETGLSSICYDTVNKTLGKMAAAASQPCNSDIQFYLVVDEINRANLATVFGELIYSLEYRGQSVATPYMVGSSNKIILPENLFIIGTMNTADKSIGSIDYAIRRRFLFFPLLPKREIICDYRRNMASNEDEMAQQLNTNAAAARLFDKVALLFTRENLSPEYYRDDVQIGHTYFLVSTVDQLYLRLKYQILPILREYYKDGMFQFGVNYDGDEGLKGLIKCIESEIDIHCDEEKLKNIFNQLIAEN